MASPVVAAVNGGNAPVDATEHTVNLPADIGAGDLLLVFFATDTAATIAFPEGWTQLFDERSSYAVRFACYYRVADGEEGATITVTTGNAQATAHTSYRITGYSGTPEAGTPATANSDSPDPPSLSPTWGAEDTLWLAVEGNERERTVSDYPINYTDGRNDYANVPTGCGVGTARRELNAVSEDPGVFTISSADDWVANTVAIRPEEEVPPVAGRSFGYIIG